MLHKTKEPTTNVSLFENGPSGPCEGRRRDGTNLVKETTKVKKIQHPVLSTTAGTAETTRTQIAFHTACAK